jgi:hypothetical protein
MLFVLCTLGNRGANELSTSFTLFDQQGRRSCRLLRFSASSVSEIRGHFHHKGGEDPTTRCAARHWFPLLLNSDADAGALIEAMGTSFLFTDS